MANICSNAMTISGNTKALNELRERIYKEDTTLIDEKEGLFTWFEGGCAYGLVNDLEDFAEPASGGFCLDFTSKWGPPTDELANLARAYPSLNFEVVFEESGNAVYGLLHYHEGRNTNTVYWTEEEYLEGYDENYADALGEVKEGTYKAFLKRYVIKGGIDTLEADNCDCRFPPHLERHILKRIQDKHLALIVGHKWLDDDNQKEYETRLKGEKKCKSKSRRTRSAASPV
jgi:hypothetical protein